MSEAHDKLGKKARKAVEVVWGNYAPKRYLPRAYHDRGPGWGVWDEREQHFVEGNRRLSKIDPQELLVN